MSCIGICPMQLRQIDYALGFARLTSFEACIWGAEIRVSNSSAIRQHFVSNE
jgi:hypothetical protein